MRREGKFFGLERDNAAKASVQSPMCHRRATEGEARWQGTGWASAAALLRWSLIGMQLALAAGFLVCGGQARH